MGQKGRLRSLSLGAFAGLAVVGLIASCSYSSLYCELNNPQQTYYPGSLKKLGDLAYIIAITSIVSLAIFLIAFIFILCDCCKCFKILLLIIGFLIWMVCFLSEIIFIGLNHWNLAENIQNTIVNDEKINTYSKSFLTKVQFAYYETEFISSLNENYSSLIDVEKIVEIIGIRRVPTFGKIEALVNSTDGVIKKIIRMPVCIFENENDKSNYTVKECIGKWNGDRLKKAIQNVEDDITKKNDREQNWDEEKINKWNFKWVLYHLIMYSNIGAYGVLPIFLGIQIGAFLFGIFYVILSILAKCCNCCKKKEDTSSEKGKKKKKRDEAEP